MSLIKKYYPELTEEQYALFEKMTPVYQDWNTRINVVSRRDLKNLEERHILHSMSLSKLIRFRSGTKVLDVGTGGGFPGIPLAILFPETEFHLVDSIRKKILVVQNVVRALGLKNVTAEHKRVQDVKTKYDFIVSRAVTSFPKFVNMVNKSVSSQQHNGLPNGLLYLKGGDFKREISKYRDEVAIFKISDYFEEEFFETKKIIYLPMK